MGTNTTVIRTMLGEQIAGDRIGHYVVELELDRFAHVDESGSRVPDKSDVLWRARHQVLPRRVAIKVCHAARSILHEACILEAMGHPGIVRVYETGLLRDRRAWLARELVVGPTVSTLLSPGAIDRVDAVALLRDLAEILEHAHVRGVIHAGIRPNRILLAGRSRSYPIAIADWSTARAHDAGPLPYIPPTVEWQYAAPELARGEAVDDRADVYSMGVIAYRILTGTLPFDIGRTALASDGSAQHVPTEVHCPDAPRELTVLVDQMLAFDRWDRPSAGEVCDALDELAASVTTIASAGRTNTGLRIRRPRWTPPITVRAVGTRDLLKPQLDDDAH